jgi:hypothetical protein
VAITYTFDQLNPPLANSILLKTRGQFDHERNGDDIRMEQKFCICLAVLGFLLALPYISTTQICSRQFVTGFVSAASPFRRSVRNGYPSLGRTT